MAAKKHVVCSVCVCLFSTLLVVALAFPIAHRMDTSSSGPHVLKYQPEGNINTDNELQDRTKTTFNRLSSPGCLSFDTQNDDDEEDECGGGEGDDDDDRDSTKRQEGKIPPTFQCESYPMKTSPFYVSPCRPVGNDTENQHFMASVWPYCTLKDTNETTPSCFCLDKYATCCGNLTGIPKLQENIRYLDFTGNNLTVLDHNTLDNVRQLEWLILNQNDISVVSSDAFHNMTSLKCLEVAFNKNSAPIDPANFTHAVNGLTQLKALSLNQTEFKNDGLFMNAAGTVAAMDEPARGSSSSIKGLAYVIRSLDLPNLEYLRVHVCRDYAGKLQRFSLSDIHKLQNLKELSIRGHNLQELPACVESSFVDSSAINNLGSGSNDKLFGNKYGNIEDFNDKNATTFCRNFSLPNLRVLDIGYNWIVQFPVFCYEESNSFYNRTVLPALTHLIASVNTIVDPRPNQMRCLPNLLILDLPGNPIRYIRRRIFQGFPKLLALDLRYTNVLVIDPEAFSHSTLATLTIKSSNWFFDTRQPGVYHMSQDLFQGSNFKFVDISYNNFRYVEPERVNHILGHLKNVEKLRMSEIGLGDIPRVITQEFTSLRSLGLKSNTISSLPDGIFRNLTQLNHLDLSDNHLTNPSAEVLMSLNTSRAVYVNLARNPFSCTCDLLHFLHLYQKNRATVKHCRHPNDTSGGLRFVGHPYKCYSPKALSKKPLKKLEMTQQMCLLTLEQEVTITTICLFFIILIVSYALLHRYRWQVRFFLYSMHVRWTKTQADQRRNRARFNAFVSYCAKDSNFVISEILPALEKGRRMPLCIHERDFVAGRYFDQNILEMMAESSHVLLVLSNAFLKDDWCRFELFVAQRYGLIYRQIPVTVLLLEPLDIKLMDVHVVMMLQSTPGLEWPGNECSTRARELFWGRLGRSLSTSTSRRRYRK